MPRVKISDGDKKKLAHDHVATNIEEYNQVLEARREAYQNHIESMQFIDPALNNWAERMAEKNGPTVKVWHNDLPWLDALLVVRYGEAVEHWPAGTSVADYGRAMDWESGKEIPEAVRTAALMSLGG